MNAGPTYAAPMNAGAEKPTVEETCDSLTGFEEIAIATHFGGEWTALAESKPTMFARALIFTVKTRSGMNARDAKKAALELKLHDVNDFFGEDEEVTPDDPETEAGKDVSTSD